MLLFLLRERPQIFLLLYIYFFCEEIKCSLSKEIGRIIMEIKRKAKDPRIMIVLSLKKMRETVNYCGALFLFVRFSREIVMIISYKILIDEGKG